IGGWAVLYSVINVLVIEIRKETGVDLSFFHLLRPEFLFYKMLAACAAAGSMLGFLGSLLSQGRSFK
ncbi:MAG TPA: hypothetical protein P5511_05630, partial [Candidatus Goldiibacteriota bacterium]|nr:hypothetical protein [Candidatus Goldiibacteriota bacterium]